MAVYWHTMDMLWEKFQRILAVYMKPISFQSKASVVCSVTTAVFIDFSLKKLNVFSQHIGKKKTNKYLNSTEQITWNWNGNERQPTQSSWPAFPLVWFSKGHWQMLAQPQRPTTCRPLRLCSNTVITGSNVFHQSQKPVFPYLKKKITSWSIGV